MQVGPRPTSSLELHRSTTCSPSPVSVSADLLLCTRPTIRSKLDGVHDIECTSSSTSTTSGSPASIFTRVPHGTHAIIPQQTRSCSQVPHPRITTQSGAAPIAATSTQSTAYLRSAYTSSSPNGSRACATANGSNELPRPLIAPRCGPSRRLHPALLLVLPLRRPSLAWHSGSDVDAQVSAELHEDPRCWPAVLVLHSTTTHEHIPRLAHFRGSCCGTALLACLGSRSAS